MGIRIYGLAPDAISAPMAGATTFFHRYELVGDALVRRKVADTRAHLAGEARLVDVLLHEDEVGRHIGVIRGVVVPERDLAGTGAAEPNWREFDVSLDIRLAIGRDLGIGPRRPRPLRLVAVDGRRLDDPASDRGSTE